MSSSKKKALGPEVTELLNQCKEKVKQADIEVPLPETKEIKENNVGNPITNIKVSPNTADTPENIINGDTSIDKYPRIKSFKILNINSENEEKANGEQLQNEPTSKQTVIKFTDERCLPDNKHVPLNEEQAYDNQLQSEKTSRQTGIKFTVEGCPLLDKPITPQEEQANGEQLQNETTSKQTAIKFIDEGRPPLDKPVSFDEEQANDEQLQNKPTTKQTAIKLTNKGCLPLDKPLPPNEERLNEETLCDLNFTCESLTSKFDAIKLDENSESSDTNSQTSSDDEVLDTINKKIKQLSREFQNIYFDILNEEKGDILKDNSKPCHFSHFRRRNLTARGKETKETSDSSVRPYDIPHRSMRRSLEVYGQRSNEVFSNQVYFNSTPQHLSQSQTRSLIPSITLRSNIISREDDLALNVSQNLRSPDIGMDIKRNFPQGINSPESLNTRNPDAMVTPPANYIQNSQLNHVGSRNFQNHEQFQGESFMSISSPFRLESSMNTFMSLNSLLEDEFDNNAEATVPSGIEKYVSTSAMAQNINNFTPIHSKQQNHENQEQSFPELSANDTEQILNALPVHRSSSPNIFVPLDDITRGILEDEFDNDAEATVPCGTEKYASTFVMAQNRKNFTQMYFKQQNYEQQEHSLPELSPNDTEQILNALPANRSSSTNFSVPVDDISRNIPLEMLIYQQEGNDSQHRNLLLQNESYMTILEHSPTSTSETSCPESDFDNNAEARVPYRIRTSSSPKQENRKYFKQIDSIEQSQASQESILTEIGFEEIFESVLENSSSSAVAEYDIEKYSPLSTHNNHGFENRSFLDHDNIGNRKPYGHGADSAHRTNELIPATRMASCCANKCLPVDYYDLSLINPFVPNNKQRATHQSYNPNETDANYFPPPSSSEMSSCLPPNQMNNIGSIDKPNKKGRSKKPNNVPVRAYQNPSNSENQVAEHRSMTYSTVPYLPTTSTSEWSYCLPLKQTNDVASISKLYKHGLSKEPINKSSSNVENKVVERSRMRHSSLSENIETNHKLDLNYQRSPLTNWKNAIKSFVGDKFTSLSKARSRETKRTSAKDRLYYSSNFDRDKYRLEYNRLCREIREREEKKLGTAEEKVIHYFPKQRSRNNYHRTNLHDALENCNFERFYCILEKHKEVYNSAFVLSLRDSHGKTVLDMATEMMECKTGTTKETLVYVVEYLKENRAGMNPMSR